MVNFTKPIRFTLRQRTIFQRYIFTLFVFILLPLLGVYLITTNILLNTIQKTREESRVLASASLSDSVKNALDSVVNTSFSIISDPTIKGYLTGTGIAYEYNRAQSNILNYIFSNKYIEDITISSINGKRILQSNLKSSHSFSDSEQELLLDTKGYFLWNQEGTALSLIRLIRDADDIQHLIGFEKIILNSSELQNIFSRLDVSSIFSYYVLDCHDHAILFSNSDDYSDSVLQIMENELQIRSSKRQQLFTHDSVSYSFIRLNRHPDYIVIVSEEPYFRQNTLRMGIIFLFMIIFIILSGLYTHSFMQKVSVPLGQLTDFVNKYEIGSSPESLSLIPAQNEIHDLISSYYSMTKRLNELYEKNFIQEINLRNSKLLILSSSMNPHFFHNAMNTIRWMIELGQKKEAMDVLNTLSDMFRLSVALSESSFVTLRQELEYVNKYMTVENYRFSGGIFFHVSVDEDLLDHNVIKFIIQPLVENSILHGILKYRKEGTVFLNIYRDGSTLIYDIRDDGIGVDEDRIQAILNNQIIKENSLEGFALSNIQSRIRLQYGNDYGIQYFNRPGGGSKVIVTQPYEE